jgi:hypothetical protein
MHLKDDDLILHYYGETTGDEEARAEQHLAVCEGCRDAFERLRQVLAMVDAQEVPEPGPAFEREVWARLQPALAPRSSWWFPWVRLALAGGVAALVVAAFLAGRFARPVDVAPQQAAVAAPSDSTERVLIVAVVDHLDRSQLVLAELLNAEVANASDLMGDQERARDLIAANRLYRQSATQTGDAATSEVLEELERVLLELANASADGPSIDLQALRERIESRGLLFRVRVVQSEMRERERQTVLAGSTS